MVELYGSMVVAIAKIFAIVLLGLMLWVLSLIPDIVSGAWWAYRMRREMRRLWGGRGPVYVFTHVPDSGGVRDVVDAWVAEHPDLCVVVDKNTVSEMEPARALWASQIADVWGQYKIPGMTGVVVVPAHGPILRDWVTPRLRTDSGDPATRFLEALTAMAGRAARTGR